MMSPAGLLVACSLSGDHVSAPDAAQAHSHQEQHFTSVVVLFTFSHWQLIESLDLRQYTSILTWIASSILDISTLYCVNVILGMFINFSPQSWIVEASFCCITKCRIINWVLDTGYITQLKAPAEVCNSSISRQHSASLCVFSIISSPDKLSHHPIITPNMSPATDICWLGDIKLLGRRLWVRRWICWYFWCWWGFYHRGDCGKMFSSLSSHFSARPSSHFTLMIADVKSSSGTPSAAVEGRH